MKRKSERKKENFFFTVSRINVSQKIFFFRYATQHTDRHTHTHTHIYIYTHTHITYIHTYIYIYI